jgi:two-component system, OmpR family, sensor histidine kinase KdpD
MTSIRRVTAMQVHQVGDLAESVPHRQVEILAGITHDLKTPLATIATSAELLEQGLDAGASTHLIAIIQRQAERLQSLVQDLSDYFSLELGAVVLHPQTIDLTDLLREYCAEFQETSTSHRLDVLLPASQVLIHADAAKIRRVLENLLRNAFKYTPAGSTVHASLKANHSTRTVTVEIEDEGPGIPEESRLSIFDPYVRLPNSTGPGQGLGLNVVKQLVEIHGGCVSVEEGTVGGARFRMELPFNCQPKG